MSPELLFNNLPIEIIHYIVFSISEPCSLLSIGLSSKALHSIVSPHLDFYTIRCDPSREGVWKKLLERPASVGFIRRLELISEGDVLEWSSIIIPKCLGPLNGVPPVETFHEDVVPISRIKLITNAVKLMGRLERFSWRAWKFISRTEIEPIFAHIKTFCPHFQELEIHHFSDSDTINRIPSLPGDCPVWPLSCLTRVSIQHFKNINDSWEYHNLEDMLITRCPLLTELRIHLEYYASVKRPTRIFSEGNWVFLRKITLSGFITLSETSVLTAFLSRHYNLRAILITMELFCSVVIESNTLPFLDSFSIDLENDFIASCDIPADVGIHIHHFAVGFKYGIMDNKMENLAHLIENMPNLKTLVIPWVDARTFELLAPRLTKLERIMFKDTIPIKPATEDLEENLNQIQPFLISLSNLTHLGGPLVISEWLEDYIPADLRRLINSMPTLKFIEALLKGWGLEYKWFEINRNLEGICIGCKEVEDDYYHLCQNWGSYFKRIGPRMDFLDGKE